MKLVTLTDAVDVALDAELEAGGPSDANRAHLVKTADALRYRAELEDDLRARREAGTPALESVVADAIAAGVAGGVEPSRNVWAASVDLARPLVEAMAEGSAAAAELVGRLVAVLVSTELPEVGPAADADRQQLEAEAMNWLGLEEAATVDARAVEAYLHRHGIRPATSHVADAIRLGGGFSKHTSLVRIEGDDGAEEIVLRQVPPGRPAPGLAAEFGVLQFAWERGIPVPEPLWLDAADNDLGGAFFATRRVTGVNQGDVFGPSPGVQPSVAEDLAAISARIHRLDVSDLDATPLAPMASTQDVLARIGDQEAIVAVAAGDTSGIYQPLFALAFAWLRTHVPDRIAPTLVHGDPGFHNILVRDGRVQVLLDWERSTVGDAAIDLAYLRPQVEAIMAWDDFVAVYRAAGGAAVDPAVVHYYTVWQDVWRAAGALKGRGRFLARPRFLLDAVTGFLHAPRFIDSATRVAFGGPDE